MCYIPTGTSNSGSHTITINELSAEYSNYQTGVESIKIAETDRVVIYPNPVTDGVFSVKSVDTIKGIEIYNASGVNVYSVVGNHNTEHLNVSVLPHGIYFVKVATAHGANVSKIVIK